MSEPVTALKGARFSGLIDVQEVPQGMITLRGDLQSAAFQTALRDLTGLVMPAQRQILHDGGASAAWMSPDELMVLCPMDQAGQFAAQLVEALKGTHALAVNVSGARAVFDLQGRHLRDVIAKLAPVDMDPAAFGPGQIRRTRLAQVPAAFWMTDETAARLICFRSVASYVFDLLCVAADPDAPVGRYAS